MPILKTDILGSVIEINFQEKEKKKLHRIINKFKARLGEFKDLEGKVTGSKIIFLSALKAEDEIEELQELLKNKEKLELSREDQLYKLNNLNKEIIELKDKIAELNNNNSFLENANSSAIAAIEKIEEKLEEINKKILSKNDDES